MGANKATEAAEQYESQIDALEAFRDAIEEADSMADTQLSELFHEARTNSKSAWKRVSAFITISDTDDVVVEKTSKLREGQWSPETRDRYDFVLSVGIEPFLSTNRFKHLVDDKIDRQIAHLNNKAANARMRASRLKQQN